MPDGRVFACCPDGSFVTYQPEAHSEGAVVANHHLSGWGKELMCGWGDVENAHIFMLPAGQWADSISKWAVHTNHTEAISRCEIVNGFQCQYSGPCIAMDTAGGSLFIAGATSVQQVCAHTGALQRAFLAARTGCYVDTAILHMGRLISGSGTIVQLFTAFCLEWTRDNHYRFPATSRAAVVVFILMQLLPGDSVTWPAEQAVIELVMDGLAPLLWDGS